MKRNLAKRVPGIAAGQMWSLDNTCLQIVELGRNTALFRILLAPGKHPLVSRSIPLDRLAVYLQASEATLLETAAPAA
jgi:hypothetical protein